MILGHFVSSGTKSLPLPFGLVRLGAAVRIGAALARRGFTVAVVLVPKLVNGEDVKASLHRAPRSHHARNTTHGTPRSHGRTALVESGHRTVTVEGPQ